MKLKTFAKSRFWERPTALEYDLHFYSREEWMDWWKQNQPKPSEAGPEEIGRRIQKRGFQEPLTGRNVMPSQLVGSEPFGTEALFVNGLNCRQRAVLKLIEDATVSRQPYEFAIFGAEAITALALVLRGRFARFVGSEYAEDDATRSWLYPIHHQNLCALDLPDKKFDLVVTNDVLEHVPDIDRALSEMARVLQPGGWHIGTVPFLYFADVGNRRALLENGKLVHLMEPE